MPGTVTAAPHGVRIRPLAREQVREFRALEDLVWFGDPAGVSDELYATTVDWDRARGAYLEDHEGMAGAYSAMGFALGLPGGVVVGLEALSDVGVHPDARRRGVLRAMMDHHFAEARERGAALAGLHASEPAIYGRFGYGPASADVRFDLGSGTGPAALGLCAEVAGDGHRARLRRRRLPPRGGGGRMGAWRAGRVPRRRTRPATR